MNKRTDNAQHRPSPPRGRGCLNRQIEAGEGALPARRQSVARPHRYSTGYRCSRTGSRGNPAFQAKSSAAPRFPGHVVRHRPRQSAAPRHTKSLQNIPLSALAAGILRCKAADCANATRAAFQLRSDRAAMRGRAGSVLPFSTYPLTRSLRDHPLPHGGEGQAARLMP